MAKKGDIIIAFSVIILAVFLFALSYMPADKLTAEIYLDGQLAETISFTETEKPYTLFVGKCEIEVSKEGVGFIKSDCPDKLCVHQGRISRTGQSIICLPNKIIVEIVGKKPDVDAVSGAR